jgi:N-ethylmaleimide reductase
MSDSSALFRPARIGSLQLAHRIVMAPMTRNRAGEGNTPTELAVRYYEQRATAALIITEGTQVSPEGVGYPNTPGIHSEAQERAWRRVTDAVHARGGRIFLQLLHVGRVSHPSLQPNGRLPVAPSAIAPRGMALTYEGPQPFVVPHALTLDEISVIVQQFAEGARRALAAGFDGVEIHGANGYLIEQFLLDGTNQRGDVYGGSIENRARFLLEVTSAVSSAVGASRVGVRLSPRGTFNDMSDANRSDIFSYAVKQLDAFGLAYLHLVDPIAPAAVAEGRLAPALRALFSGPLIINGGFDRETGAAAIERGDADFVAYGVKFLANPDLPERWRLGARLNDPIRETFYGGDGRGYVDYPTLAELEAGSTVARAASAPARPDNMPLVAAEEVLGSHPRRANRTGSSDD